MACFAKAITPSHKARKANLGPNQQDAGKMKKLYLRAKPPGQSCTNSMDPEFRIRKRIPKSCRRCHRRKQKCVGSPTCSNCESANQPCSRSESAPSWHHGMSKGALVHRIEILEAQLATALEGTIPDIGEESGSTPIAVQQKSPPASIAKKAHLKGVVRFLTLGHDANGEPAYLGPSSGLSMAENVSRIVHNSVGSRLLPISGNNQQPEALQETVQAKAAPPDDATGSQILDAYFLNMHMRLPFLDRTEILKLHAKRHESPNNTPEAQFGRFKLFMVYAIGSAIRQTTDSDNSTLPNQFLLTALDFDSTLRESISIASIEAMLLLVLYNLRTTSNSSVWYMIGLAMRTCLDFGFHRETSYGRLSQHETELRRRLFWSVYIIERYTAWSLGRPFSVAEEEIDAAPPSNIDDSITNDSAIERILQNRSVGRGRPHKGTLGRFIASIQLQRIVSRIHTRIYRVDAQISALTSEIHPLLSSLQEFKATLAALDVDEGDFLHMHWNSSIRILLQPFLSFLHPQDSLIGTCLFASGQMCQFFKKLRQRETSSGSSFLLVNSVFMAGVTMCYCLFRSPGLWTPAVSNDLRACSSALFLMAEHNPRLKTYRDGLETIINRAMDYVQEASVPQQANQGRLPTPTTDRGLMLEAAISTEPLPGTGHHAQPLQDNALPETTTRRFDSINTEMFSDLHEILNFRGDMSGHDIDGVLPFHGIFTEDFWATDAFNLPTFDGFGWRS